MYNSTTNLRRNELLVIGQVAALEDPEPKKEGLGNLIGTLKGLTKSFGNFAKKLGTIKRWFPCSCVGRSCWSCPILPRLVRKEHYRSNC